jgi:hypothetical protein
MMVLDHSEIPRFACEVVLTDGKSNRATSASAHKT